MVCNQNICYNRIVKDRSGFTLTELLIIVAIVGILAITAVIPILETRALRLDAAAQRLVYDIRYAQQLAINRQVDCGVSFSIINNSYFVYIGTTATKATDPLTKGDLEIDYDTDSNYQGVDLISTNLSGNQLAFMAPYLGAPSDGAGSALASQGTVSLQMGSETETVTIQPDTGEVKI